MVKAREFCVRASHVALALGAAWALSANTAAAEGVSFGLSGGASGGPDGASAKGDSAASAAPAAPESASPPPEADAPRAEPHLETNYDRNPSNYEFGFVTAGIYQTWNLVGNSIYFGMGGGLGPPLYRVTKLSSNGKFFWDSALSIAYANAFLRFTTGNIDLDVGPKIGIGSLLYDPSDAQTKLDDAPMSFFEYGAYVDLRVGTRAIKVGPRIEYDRMALAGFYDTALRITPLMLRWTH